MTDCTFGERMGTKMRFFLIGFMGSGKTYWGRKLAERHGIPFIDLDDLISRAEVKSIPALFAECGEAGFRSLESKYLKELIAHQDHFILATGGGTPCFHHHMDLMNQHGITVYLRCSPALLFERLNKEITSRPLLADVSKEHLLEHIRQLLSLRERDYQKSRYRLDMETANEHTFEQIFLQHV